MPLTPIPTTITWHPGGAQRDSEGRSPEWPWGESLYSPLLTVEWEYGWLGHRTRIYKVAWHKIVRYHGYADLDPPKCVSEMRPSETGGRMTTEEAKNLLKRWSHTERSMMGQLIPDAHCVRADAIDTILAALDAATRRAEEAEQELSQALERWPGDGSPGDEIGLVSGKYCVIVPDVRLHESEVKRFTNRIDAARCAAGLPAKGAADEGRA